MAAHEGKSPAGKYEEAGAKPPAFDSWRADGGLKSAFSFVAGSANLTQEDLANIKISGDPNALLGGRFALPRGHSGKDNEEEKEKQEILKFMIMQSMIQELTDIAEQIEKLQKEIEELKRQREEIEKQEEKLTDQLKQINSDLEKCERRIQRVHLARDDLKGFQKRVINKFDLEDDLVKRDENGLPAKNKNGGLDYKNKELGWIVKSYERRTGLKLDPEEREDFNKAIFQEVALRRNAVIDKHGIPIGEPIKIKDGWPEDPELAEIFKEYSANHPKPDFTNPTEVIDILAKIDARDQARKNGYVQQKNEVSEQLVVAGVNKEAVKSAYAEKRNQLDVLIKREKEILDDLSKADGNHQTIKEMVEKNPAEIKRLLGDPERKVPEELRKELTTLLNKNETQTEQPGEVVEKKSPVNSLPATLPQGIN